MCTLDLFVMREVLTYELWILKVTKVGQPHWLLFCTYYNFKSILNLAAYFFPQLVLLDAPKYVRAEHFLNYYFLQIYAK